MEDKKGLDVGRRRRRIGLMSGRVIFCFKCSKSNKNPRRLYEIRYVCTKPGRVCMNFIWFVEICLKYMQAALNGDLPHSCAWTDPLFTD